MTAEAPEISRAVQEWTDLGWPAEGVRRALAVCALAPVLDDVAAWEALAACKGGLEQYVWYVPRCGLVEASGAVRWRVRHGLRRALCDELDYATRRAAHAALERFYGSSLGGGHGTRGFAARLLNAYHGTAEAVVEGNDRNVESSWERWTDLEQGVRIGRELSGQHELARLGVDLEETGQIPEGRTNVIFLRAMYLYSAKRYGEAAPHLHYLNANVSDGRIGGIARHCLGRLVMNGLTEPPGASKRVQATEGLYWSALKLLMDAGDSVGTCLVGCSLAELYEHTGRALRGAKILDEYVQSEGLPVGLRVGFFLTRGTVLLSSLSKQEYSEVAPVLEEAKNALDRAWEEALAGGTTQDKVWVLLARARCARKRGAPIEALEIVDQAAQEALDESNETSQIANQRGCACLDVAQTLDEGKEREQWLEQAESAFSVGLDSSSVPWSTAKYQRYGLARVLHLSGRDVEALQQLDLLLGQVPARDTKILALVSRLITDIDVAWDWKKVRRRLTWAMTVAGAEGRRFYTASLKEALDWVRERIESSGQG